MKSIKIVIVSLIIGLLSFNSYKEIKTKIYNMQENLYCGKVIEKVSEEKHHKGRYSHTERYLVIDFGKDGFHSINTNENTYFTTEVGKSVCFTLSNRQMGKDIESSFWNELSLILLTIISIILLLVGLIYIGEKLGFD
jgi:hypothetical protein